jgi:hypothetical protein
MNAAVGLLEGVNPFPGLRPFEPHEAGLFFGREEQCDELLDRLRNRRMVAVVGGSGSGKSSLVRAGLIPALERGYLPSAGSSWRISICRPGVDPIGNLARSLCAGRSSDRPVPQDDPDDIRETLEANSLGLAAAAHRLIDHNVESLLVVVDQFEELFRFRRVGGVSADEDAAGFVKLLISAVETRDVRLYIVLTMRTDYLGDCPQFRGLPEALNDSQYLVPQMTRDQLKEAIEGPVSVSGAQVTPRLVQRLLHDVERLSKGFGRTHNLATEPDPLPLLQHALMRVWNVASPARQRGERLDLPHYEDPSVNTLWNALDLHAEEAFAGLPDEEARAIAARAFQRLTERDPANRDIRRATSLEEITAVALRLDVTPTAADLERVRGVLRHFIEDGRSFLFFDQQDTVDISHESLIRQWKRLGGWVEEEVASKRIFTGLAASAEEWARDGSLLYGRKLKRTLDWWRKQRPSRAWAARYDGHLDLAWRFLKRSVLARLLFRVAFGVGAIVVAALIWMDITRARQLAERDRDYAQRTEARERQFSEQSQQRAAELERANALLQQAIAAQKKGQSGAAEKLTSEATQVSQQADSRPTLRSDETAELELLRKLSKQWAVERQQLTRQLAESKQPATARGGGKPLNPGATPPPLDPGKPGNAASGAAIVATGNYIEAFRDGVQGADRGEWATTARLMQDAIRFQPGSQEVVSQVRVYGVRFEPYSPYSFLALALLELKDCGNAGSALKQSEREVKSKSIENRLRDRRRRCGL